MAKCLMCEVCPAISNPAESSGYSLPTASSTQLGGVKVGYGLSIADDGTLNVTTTGGQSNNVIENISLDGTIQPIVGKTAILGLSVYAKKTDVTGALSAAIGGLSNYALLLW